MLRSPFGPRATKVAPSASMIAGWSFPGSPFATFPPTVAHQRIGDQRNGVGENGVLGADQIGALERRLPRHRPDLEKPALLLDVVEPRNAADIHQVRERCKAQLQHGQEAHAAGEDLGLVAVTGEQLHRLVERARTVIIECRRNHRSPLSALCAPQLHWPNQDGAASSGAPYLPGERMPTGYYFQLGRRYITPRIGASSPGSC